MSRRPFYSEYAWAFDLLVDRPVRKECATIVAWLIERGVLPGARVLDAGCGTGRYAVELARRGFAVHGIDSSPELVDVARRQVAGPSNALSFSEGDIAALAPARYDAILCRGVLNDFVEDGERRAVFDGFARSLRPEGVLILDVREWETTAERKRRERLFRKRVSTDRGELTFTSVTDVDPARRRLIIRERHTLADDDGERSSEYTFVMGCWTVEELRAALHTSGFSGEVFFGAYDSAVAPGATDRLVAAAVRSNAR